MPVIEKKPAPKVVAPPPAPVDPIKPGLTRAEVEHMLTMRDVAWQLRLDAAVKAALASLPKPQPPAPKKKTKVEFHTDARGYPTGFTINPEN